MPAPRTMRPCGTLARICHHLTADDAVIRVPPECYIRCLEADLAHADGRIVQLKRKPRQRKPRVKTLIERTEKATGRPATGVTYHADGSRTIAIGDMAEGERANGNESNLWDEVPSYV